MTPSNAIICDLDGTLCNHAHRLHFVDPQLAGCHKEESKWGGHWWTKDSNTRWEPDYRSFYAAMDKDTLNEWCFSILCSIQDGQWQDCRILYVTERPHKYYRQTQQWLLDQNLFSQGDYIFMRPECVYPPLDPKDPDGTVIHRMDKSNPASIPKKWIYETEIKDKYDVLFVLEDEENCAQMYKSLGLTVLKVLT